MAAPHVITNRRRLDQFFRDGKALDDIGMIVGQVTGKPKYPVGHVGKRSREKGRKYTRKVPRKTLERLAMIRAASKQLEGLDKETYKKTRSDLVARFKKAKIRFGGLGGRKSRPVAVARVAGVIASDKNTGQYHERVLGKLKVVKINPDAMRAAMMRTGKTISQVLTDFGKEKKAKLRASFAATGHTDTGRITRNIQYQIFTIGGRAALRKREREAKAARRELSKSTKRAKSAKASKAAFDKLPG